MKYLVATKTSGISYYIAPNAGSGAGTFASPFGLDDLQSFVGGVYVPGPAFQPLQAGDILYFRGGTYHLTGTDNYEAQLLGPTRSGAAGFPITIRSYPGETVNIIVDGDPNTAVFGSRTPALNYVRFQGFHISLSPTCRGFTIAGIGCEVSYNEVIAQNLETTDNHDAIDLYGADNAWVHHNVIHGSTGSDYSTNSSGIKVYDCATVLVEDNYIYGCGAAVYDKDGGAGVVPRPADFYHQATYRRNYFLVDPNPSNVKEVVAWGGNGQLNSPLSRYFVYDNVLAGPVTLGKLQDGDQVYNNLIYNLGKTSNSKDGGSPPPYGYLAWKDAWGVYPDLAMVPVTDSNVWNNVMFAASPAITPYSSDYNSWVPPGDGQMIAYMDYNVYAGDGSSAPTPYYDFGYAGARSIFTLAQFQALGYEQNTNTVLGPLSVYNDLTGYVLKTVYQTAGRYGDAVGPRVPIGGPGGIMDTTRYGPGAL